MLAVRHFSPSRALWALLLVLLSGRLGLVETTPPPGRSMVLVVCGHQQRPGHPKVEALVNSLKRERALLELSSKELPLLRLDPRNDQHAPVLKELGIAPAEEAQSFLASMGPKGWPVKPSSPLSAGSQLGRLLGRTAKAQSAPSSATIEKPKGNTSERTESSLEESGPDTRRLGLLVFHNSQDTRQEVKLTKFLSELGRYWAQRYSRIKPTPYPLASYDLARPSRQRELHRSFGELANPEELTVSLCLFDEKMRPRKILKSFRELELPAQTVRRLSAARREALALPREVSEPSEQAPPKARTLTLGSTLETRVQIRRLHELSQQLLDSSAVEAGSPTRETLKSLVQLTRSQSRVSKELLKLFSSYRQHPVKAKPGSNLFFIERRFRSLSTELFRLAPNAR